MTTSRRDLQNLTAWLADLANLTAGTVPLPDAKAKIASLATILAETYPPAAFTRASLTEVARHCKYFPSYSELCDHLTLWWRENPLTLAITDSSGLDQNARLWVNYFRKREAEHFRVEPGQHPSSRAHVLSLVKQQSHDAWKHLTGNSAAPNRAPTETERSNVRRAVAAMASDLNNAHDAVYAKPGSKAAERPAARYLTRTELNAEYAKAGIKGPHIA